MFCFARLKAFPVVRVSVEWLVSTLSRCKLDLCDLKLLSAFVNAFVSD